MVDQATPPGCGGVAEHGAGAGEENRADQIALDRRLAMLERIHPWEHADEHAG